MRLSRAPAHCSADAAPPDVRSRSVPVAGDGGPVSLSTSAILMPTHPAPTRFVHYYPDALSDSGVNVALWGWAAALQRHGCEVLVLHDRPSPTGRVGTEPFVPAAHRGVEHRRIAHRGRGRLSRHPVDLARHMRQGDVLILHEGWVTNNLVAAQQATRAGIPYLTCPHGVYEPAWRRYLRPPQAVRAWAERRTLERAAAVHLFFQSESVAALAVAPRARFVVAPTGFEPPEERWRGGGGYLSWVGRYDPTHKGLDILVAALAAMDPVERPVVRLRGYDYRGGLPALRAMVAAHPGLDRWVDVGGPISGTEKRDFLVASDGYLLPSRWESHSVALLEVLALGLPALVSDVLHVAPQLRAHRAAVLAPPEPAGLAEALVALRTASDVGDRARQLVESEYAWERIVPVFLERLETLGLMR
jgi:glycosyltransferase involved in cell wall biosynthesis